MKKNLLKRDFYELQSHRIMIFSILIPVYNVERYLPQCLESVLSQDYDDYEVILVNDGSTDNGPQICESYAKKDGRIRYLSKPNEGLLLTRRYSLQYAKGEYILFLDSDDYWEPGLLSTLANEIKQDASVDMILYRYKRIRDKGRVIYDDKGIFEDHTIFTPLNKDVFLEEFVSSSRLNTMWSKCVRRDIVDIDADYSMYKDKKGEDLLQSITLIQNAQKILYLDKVLYSYRLSPTGRGRNFKKKYIEDFDVVRTHVYKKLQEMDASASVKRKFLDRYINTLYNFIPSLISSCSSYSDFFSSICNIREFTLYKRIKEECKTQQEPQKNREIINQIESDSWRIKYHVNKLRLITEKWLRKFKHKSEDVMDRIPAIKFDYYRIEGRLGGGQKCMERYCLIECSEDYICLGKYRTVME